jgi:hypothetical protein
MKITQRCRLNGQVYEMNIPKLTPEMLQEGMARRHAGGMIQDCFPTLTPSEREFLLTGTPPNVWDSMFGMAPEDTAEDN